MSFPLTFLLYKFRFIAELFLNDYEISFPGGDRVGGENC